MKKRSAKKLGLGLVSLGILGGLAACGNGNSSAEGEAEEGKTLTVSVDSGYKDYINEIKDTLRKRKRCEDQAGRKGHVRSVRIISVRWACWKGT